MFYKKYFYLNNSDKICEILYFGRTQTYDPNNPTFEITVSPKNSISDYKGKIEQLTGEKTEMLKEQGKLEKGLPSYNHAVSSLIEVIESGIYDSTGEKIRAIPLCELIDVAEGQEAWRNALEGYLNTRRFDLFVPEEYYDKSVDEL